MGGNVLVWLPFHVLLCCGVCAGLWGTLCHVLRGWGWLTSATCVPWYVPRGKQGPVPARRPCVSALLGPAPEPAPCWHRGGGGGAQGGTLANAGKSYGPPGRGKKAGTNGHLLRGGRICPGTPPRPPPPPLPSPSLHGMPGHGRCSDVAVGCRVLRCGNLSAVPGNRPVIDRRLPGAVRRSPADTLLKIVWTFAPGRSALPLRFLSPRVRPPHRQLQGAPGATPSRAPRRHPPRRPGRRGCGAGRGPARGRGPHRRHAVLQRRPERVAAARCGPGRAGGGLLPDPGPPRVREDHDRYRDDSAARDRGGLSAPARRWSRGKKRPAMGP